MSSNCATSLSIKSPSTGDLTTTHALARNSSSCVELPRTSSGVALNHCVGNLSIRSSGANGVGRSDGGSCVRHPKRLPPTSVCGSRDSGRFNTRRGAGAIPPGWHCSDPSRYCLAFMAEGMELWCSG